MVELTLPSTAVSKVAFNQADSVRAVVALLQSDPPLEMMGGAWSIVKTVLDGIQVIVLLLEP